MLAGMAVLWYVQLMKGSSGICCARLWCCWETCSFQFCSHQAQGQAHVHIQLVYVVHIRQWTQHISLPVWIQHRCFSTSGEWSLHAEEGRPPGTGRRRWAHLTRPLWGRQGVKARGRTCPYGRGCWGNQNASWCQGVVCGWDPPWIWLKRLTD